MKKYVYRVGVEVEHMEGCQLPKDCKGAFVNVYLSADNIREAIDIAESELFSDFYKPVNTYEAFEIDLEGEELERDNDDQSPTIKELRNYPKENKVSYGTFHCFPYEDEN